MGPKHKIFALSIVFPSRQHHSLIESDPYQGLHHWIRPPDPSSILYPQLGTKPCRRHSPHKTGNVTETASIRSTSTMSSLKALLPGKRSDKEEKKEKPRPEAPTPEERARSMEARATYMSMMK